MLGDIAQGPFQGFMLALQNLVLLVLLIPDLHLWVINEVFSMFKSYLEVKLDETT